MHASVCDVPAAKQQARASLEKQVSSLQTELQMALERIRLNETGLHVQQQKQRLLEDIVRGQNGLFEALLSRFMANNPNQGEDEGWLRELRLEVNNTFDKLGGERLALEKLAAGEAESDTVQRRPSCNNLSLLRNHVLKRASSAAKSLSARDKAPDAKEQLASSRESTESTDTQLRHGDVKGEISRLQSSLQGLMFNFRHKAPSAKDSLLRASFEKHGSMPTFLCEQPLDASDQSNQENTAAPNGQTPTSHSAQSADPSYPTSAKSAFKDEWRYIQKDTQKDTQRVKDAQP